MKKNFIFALGIFFSMITLFSCGDGGAAEKEAARLDSIRKADSIAAIMLEQHIKDSLMQDSIMKAQALADSLAALEVATPGTVKPKTNTTKPATTTTAATTTVETPKTGKDAVKGTTTTSGKDAIKSSTTGTGKTGGKMDIKKGGN